MAEFPSWGSGSGSTRYLVSLDKIAFFPSCFSSPGAGASRSLGSGAKTKLGVAGEPSLPAFVALGDFSRSPLPGPNLQPAHLIPVLCLQTLVASRAVQVAVPLVRCHLVHVWCCLSAAAVLVARWQPRARSHRRPGAWVTALPGSARPRSRAGWRCPRLVKQHRDPVLFSKAGP